LKSHAQHTERHDHQIECEKRHERATCVLLPRVSPRNSISVAAGLRACLLRPVGCALARNSGNERPAGNSEPATKQARRPPATTAAAATFPRAPPRQPPTFRQLLHFPTCRAPAIASQFQARPPLRRPFTSAVLFNATLLP
jgi:hypothetical protein